MKSFEDLMKEDRTGYGFKDRSGWRIDIFGGDRNLFEWLADILFNLFGL